MTLELDIDMNTINRGFAVYSHTYDGRVFYVGSCRYQELLSFPDAKHNDKWREFVKSVTNFKLKLIMICTTPEEARKIAETTATITQAYCNKHGLTTIGRLAAIECINDERKFESIAEAAREYRIPSTSISNHLANRPGYAHVNGYKFKRISARELITSKE